MEHEPHATGAAEAGEPDSQSAEEGFAATRFFTGQFAHKVAQQQRQRRKRRAKLLAIAAGAGLTGIALLSLAVSLTT